MLVRVQISTQTYTYDDASNVATHTQGGVQTTYGYDDIDQLTSESRTGYSASYTYDANGNRLTRTIGGTTEDYTYDDADKLDKIEISSVTVKDFSYDAAGRTTSVVTGAGTTTLAYDYENRITTITYPSTATNTFTYNGLDTRVGKVDSAGTHTFKRDGAGVTAPVLSDGSAAYTPGLSERRSSTSTFSHSGIKNAQEQTASNQTSAATRVYDAFGNLASSTGTWKGPFGYGGGFGYQTDGDSGLKLLGHRYYDSSTGRFLTRDIAQHGRNWYCYCENNPVSWADPTGQVRIEIRFWPVTVLGITLGFHMEVVIIDNQRGSRSYGKGIGYNGGPGGRRGRWLGDVGELEVIKGAPRGGKPFATLVLLDNGDPIGPYEDKADSTMNQINKQDFNYDVIYSNSNAVANEILADLGLPRFKGVMGGWIDLPVVAPPYRNPPIQKDKPPR